MIHLSEKTWRFPDTGMTLPFVPANILTYLMGQSETLFYDFATPTTTITYEYDPTCCTLSNTTNTATNYTYYAYDPGNSSINTGKSSSPYNYDNICDLHPCESRSKDKATYVDSWVYYYGYRYYSPELGRWVSRDPIGETGGINRYIAIGNSIPNTWDYLGLQSSVLQRCKTTIQDFLERNSELLAEFTFVDDDPFSLTPEDSWDPHKVRTEERRGRNCQVYWECQCEPCLYGLTAGGGWAPGREHKAVISEPTGVHDGVRQYEERHYRVVVNNIYICTGGNVSKPEMERTMLHELQHAKDRCDILDMGESCSELYPYHESSPGDREGYKECLCADSLCKEMRAFQHTMPGASPEEIFARITRRGSRYREYDGCSEPLNDNPSGVFEHLQTRCSMTEGMFPEEQIQFSDSND